MENTAVAPVNTNPMHFEELASSLATLATYARGDLNAPLDDMQHLYTRALQEPPGYAEITSITGQSLQTLDRQRGRGAWLLMNVEGLDIYGVHCRVWHRIGKKFYAPLLDQVGRVLKRKSVLSDAEMQEAATELCLIDIVGVKDDAIWLTQVVSDDNVTESALNHFSGVASQGSQSVVYGNASIDGKALASLASAYKQMRLAFPDTDVLLSVLVLHSRGPDFELYSLQLPEELSGDMSLPLDWIKKNSIQYADVINERQEALFELPRLVDNKLFRGIPPCRGGRTLGTLASAASRQLASDELLTWERKDVIQMLRDDFAYEIEKDKVRHDLDDRLVAQGFFRKFGSRYYVSTKGIARYQYCLAKFTTLGAGEFDLQLCVAQKDRISDSVGCFA